MQVARERVNLTIFGFAGRQVSLAVAVEAGGEDLDFGHEIFSLNKKSRLG
jgi:hypothetical protein